MKFVSVLVVLLIADYVHGQTNSDLRAVNGKIYDVNKSPEWVSITVPSNSLLESPQDIHYKGVPLKISAVFRPNYFVINGGSPRISINNFPYNPAAFYMKNNYVVTKQVLKLRVFPIYPATTNYDALGHMKISRPRDFDFGIPTNHSPIR